MLDYVRELLAANSFDVVGVAGDGQAAMEAALELHPDVIVLDISMPVLNGIQAAKRLREFDPSSKIVFLTVDRDSDICRAALETGALGYVLKPRLASDLIPAVKQALLGLQFVSPGCE